MIAAMTSRPTTPTSDPSSCAASLPSQKTMDKSLLTPKSDPSSSSSGIKFSSSVGRVCPSPEFTTPPLSDENQTSSPPHRNFTTFEPLSDESDSDDDDDDGDDSIEILRHFHHRPHNLSNSKDGSFLPAPQQAPVQRVPLTHRHGTQSMNSNNSAEALSLRLETLRMRMLHTEQDDDFQDETKDDHHEASSRRVSQEEKKMECSAPNAKQRPTRRLTDPLRTSTNSLTNDWTAGIQSPPLDSPPPTPRISTPTPQSPSQISSSALFSPSSSTLSNSRHEATRRMASFMALKEPHLGQTQPQTHNTSAFAPVCTTTTTREEADDKENRIMLSLDRPALLEHRLNGKLTTTHRSSSSQIKSPTTDSRHNATTIITTTTTTTNEMASPPTLPPHLLPSTPDTFHTPSNVVSSSVVSDRSKKLRRIQSSPMLDTHSAICFGGYSNDPPRYTIRRLPKERNATKRLSCVFSCCPNDGSLNDFSTLTSSGLRPSGLDGIDSLSLGALGSHLSLYPHKTHHNNHHNNRDSAAAAARLVHGTDAPSTARERVRRSLMILGENNRLSGPTRAGTMVMEGLGCSCASLTAASTTTTTTATITTITGCGESCDLRWAVDVPHIFVHGGNVIVAETPFSTTSFVPPLRRTRSLGDESDIDDDNNDTIVNSSNCPFAQDNVGTAPITESRVALDLYDEDDEDNDDDDDGTDEPTTDDAFPKRPTPPPHHFRPPVDLDDDEDNDEEDNDDDLEVLHSYKKPKGFSSSSSSSSPPRSNRRRRHSLDGSPPRLFNKHFPALITTDEKAITRKEEKKKIHMEWMSQKLRESAEYLKQRRFLDAVRMYEQIIDQHGKVLSGRRSAPQPPLSPPSSSSSVASLPRSPPMIEFESVDPESPPPSQQQHQQQEQQQQQKCSPPTTHNNSSSSSEGSKGDRIIGSMLHNMGNAYMWACGYDEAARSFRLALEVRKRVLEPDHRDILVTIVKLGITLYALSQFDEAEATFMSALSRMREEYRERDNPELGKLFNNLGCLYVEMNEHVESLKWFRKALDVYNAILIDPSHDDATAINAATAMSNICVVYAKRKEYDETVGALEQALSLQLSSLAESHNITMTTMDSLGLAASLVGDYEMAAKVYESLYEIQKSTLGSMHVMSGRTLQRLSEVLMKMSSKQKQYQQNQQNSGIKRFISRRRAMSERFRELRNNNNKSIIKK